MTGTMAKIDLDLRSDRERQHREYMERQRADEIRLEAAKAERAAQFAEEAKAETMSDPLTVYLPFEDQDELVSIWRHCVGKSAYPTILDWALPETDRDPRETGLLRIDLQPSSFDGDLWFFYNRQIDFEKLQADNALKAKQLERTIRDDMKAREEAKKFTGCGDPTYRAGGSR